MLLFPNAKINLGLNIVSKRADGYHNLETIFYPIPISDALEIIEDNNVSEKGYVFTTSGMEVLASDENNLCVKAYLLLKEQFDLPNVKMHLHKIIPMGGGLGGGSADASFVLLALNQIFSLSLTSQQLINLALKLGADCPFFTINMPCVGKGVGEILEPISISLKGYYLVLLNPNIHVSTANAFSAIKPKRPVIAVNEIIIKPKETWRALLKNDFEESVFSQFPVIESFKESLYNDGAFYASMSGSGASVYALFENIPDQITNEDFVIWRGFLQ